DGWAKQEDKNDAFQHIDGKNQTNQRRQNRSSMDGGPFSNRNGMVNPGCLILARITQHHNHRRDKQRAGINEQMQLRAREPAQANIRQLSKTEYKREDKREA